MKGKNSLGFRISIPIIITTSMLLIVIVLVNDFLFNDFGKKELYGKLERETSRIKGNLDLIQDKAMWISSTCSSMQVVKKAYNQYYKTHDLESSSKIIEQEFNRVNTSIYNNTSEKPKIHFHLPPATSFIRCWSSKRGDDISSFRNTVLAISKNHKPISGIEVGRGGFVIRGIAPIFEGQKYLGSVETLFPIRSIISKADLSKDEEFAVFMKTDLLKIATNFLESSSSNVSMDKKRIGKYIFVNSTSDKFNFKKLPQKAFKKELKQKTYYEKDNLIFEIFPIFNYMHESVGLGVLQLKKSNLLSSIKRAQTINILLGIIILVLLIILISFLIKFLVSKPVKKIVRHLKKISDKEIDFRIEEVRNDEIGELFESINEINTNFEAIMSKINSTAQEVINASNQLSTISQQIAQSANEQSATTEEVSSSMEEILTMASSNTLNAEITGETALSSVNKTKTSSAIFMKTIESVSEINDKISIISEIASKTDLLSINTSIEAARSGKAGKGFAVVAEEIRKLAHKTRIASDEINKLSQNGQNLSNQAKEELEELIPELVASLEHVNSIVAGSKEQQTGIESVNTAILQLSDITATNSEVADKMSTSAEKLAIQSEQLKSIISVFKFKAGV